MNETLWQMTEHEKNVLYPLVVNILSHRSKEKVFSNTSIREILSEFGESIADVQIRKIVFNIRRSGDIPLLLANSEGYFVGNSIEEVEAWINTHLSKIEAMKASLDSILKQFEEERSKIRANEGCKLLGQISIFDLI